MEAAWAKIPASERDAAMDAFLSQLVSDMVGQVATGREQLADLWPPRRPGGALPVPDDTPWAPPRRKRKA